MPIETSPTLGTKRLTIIKVPEPGGASAFGDAVRRGLSSQPKWLPCQFFYDAAGSQLFEKICNLPEYYLTRTEDAILREHADAMVAAWSHAPVFVELGSGSSLKTQRLINAALTAYGELHYIPIDVSATILEHSAHALVRKYPRLRVTGYAADYRNALTSLASRINRPKCLVFLGSSLGNYDNDEAVSLLSHIARTMGPDDRLLLGTDLVKDAAVLEAAYDDAQGVTAEFNLNLLARMNRELDADFDLNRFSHKALYRSDQERIEMHLVSQQDQQVKIRALGFSVSFTRDESIHTENSHKYTFARLRWLAECSGLREEAAWTDERNWFRVQRWRRRSSTP